MFLDFAEVFTPHTDWEITFLTLFFRFVFFFIQNERLSVKRSNKINTFLFKKGKKFSSV